MALAAPVSGGLGWIAAVNVMLDTRIRKIGRDQ
jgi:hypothetical protein